MGEFPPRTCQACGKNEGPMAMVSDPFSDQCYGLCRVCLSRVWSDGTDELLGGKPNHPEDEPIWTPGGEPNP